MATLTDPQTKPHTVAHADLSRLILGVFLSALGGVMLLLSFPPYGIWPLAWIGFVPFLFAQYRLMPLNGRAWRWRLPTCSGWVHF